MTNSKNTKRALLASALSILMCVAMLIGTTFAWFTDTASTAVNKIQAGNLHVEIQNEAGGRIENLEWIAKDGRAQDEILWEPGCTYTLTPFKIVNTGNLALKYTIVITGLDGDADLLKVIQFTYETADGIFDMTAEGHLTAKGTEGSATKLITVSAHMDEAAGNEYQDMKLEGVKFTVYATQDTVESDSFNNRYDADATYYPVIDAAGLKEALTKGGEVTVAADVRTNNKTDLVSARMVIGAPTTLNLNKKIISPDNMGENGKNFAALYVDADTTINAGKDGGIDTGVNGGYGINVRNGAKLTINGGYYYGGGTAIQVQKGELVINSGFFQVEPYNDPKYGNKFLLNCIDAALKDGSAKITVYGGTFVNYDPADSASENPHGNFVADGYSVISETKPNGDVWYTVVKGTGVIAGTQEEFDAAVAADSTVTVKLENPGTYALPSGMTGKDVTIIGTKETVIDVPKAIALHNAAVTMEGVTVKSPNADYTGLQHTAATIFKDCSIEGQPFLYATDAQFIGCTFTQTSSSAYNVWTYGAENVLFKDCVFNCAGKSVLIYNEGSIAGQVVEFQNCKFNASAPVAGKAAIEIDSSLLKGDATYKVIIDQATADSVTGFGKGTNSNNSVWNNKKGDNATVIVAGKTVLSAK